MEQFLDMRDKFVWITHLHLLIGMSLTYFMSVDRVIRSSSVILPIGDAFAAIIGKKYGRIKVIKYKYRYSTKVYRDHFLLSSVVCLHSLFIV